MQKIIQKGSNHMSDDVKKLALDQAKKFGGKLEIKSKVKINDKKDLSAAYTPGVAAVSSAIANNKNLAYSLTIKKNTVAIVSDGSAILGLGNIGPEAAMPVMEGKAALFKRFANIDAIPIVLGTQDSEEIIKTVKAIAPTFGGINLEDISAPRCFEIEKRLIDECDIPVFHDDQHGTAIVVLAATYNSLKLIHKKLADIKIVINGAGAAGLSIAKILLAAGAKDITLLNSKGIINEEDPNLRPHLKNIAKKTNRKHISGGLHTALKDTDLFIGVSVADLLKKEWIKDMAGKPIIFAMANPNPEIMPDKAIAGGAYIVGTGRSDFPNQINNVLAFPGIFRGALDVRAKKITMKMQIAAAKGIASLIPDDQLKHLPISFLMYFKMAWLK